MDITPECIGGETRVSEVFLSRRFQCPSSNSLCNSCQCSASPARMLYFESEIHGTYYALILSFNLHVRSRLNNNVNV